jgi:Holliday junction DNA helicase RuvA
MGETSMFDYIRGEVAHTEPYLAVIDAGGVGYACHTSLSTLRTLHTGQTARLYTFLYLREGICDLYGFAAREELAAFKMLIGISGVGPRVATAILSVTTPERLALSVLTGDEKALTAASGVGKKLAQRIVLELKDKLGKSFSAPASTSGSASLVGPGALTQVGEAQAALMVLGYSAAESLQALNGIDAEEMSVEALIRAALRRMVK